MKCKKKCYYLLQRPTVVQSLSSQSKVFGKLLKNGMGHNKKSLN